ncbi:MAG: hypothetical protein KBS59_04380 [Clostridiales bacterium]|nr:hypothetical protein [Clostridiales bacterium]
MAMNRKCPKCGSDHVQMSQENKKKHGFLWFLLFGWAYLIFILFKWIIGLIVLVLLDWWLAIIKAVAKKGYVWKCKRFFSGKRRVYYCHDCGYNFKA